AQPSMDLPAMPTPSIDLSAQPAPAPQSSPEPQTEQTPPTMPPAMGGTIEVSDPIDASTLNTSQNIEVMKPDTSSDSDSSDMTSSLLEKALAENSEEPETPKEEVPAPAPVMPPAMPVMPKEEKKEEE